MKGRLRIFAVAAAVGAALPSYSVLFDFNAGGSGWTSTFNTAAFDGPWTWGAAAGAGGSGGWFTEGQDPGNTHANTTDLTSPALIVAASGAVTLSLDHLRNFEAPNWDGGAVYISVNGGAFTYVPNSSFTANGYNGTVASWAQGSELGGLEAWIGSSGGAFVTSSANLGSFTAGDSLMVRFRAAFDENTTGGSPDWAIDNVNVTNIVPEPASMTMLGLGALLLARRRRRA